MALRSENYVPGLTQTGPANWENNPVEIKTRIADSVVQFRRISLSPSQRVSPDGKKIPNMVLLTGEVEAYDGNLQGLYLAYPPSSTDPENGGSTIYSDDNTIRWKKLT